VEHRQREGHHDHYDGVHADHDNHGVYAASADDNVCAAPGGNNNVVDARGHDHGSGDNDVCSAGTNHDGGADASAASAGEASVDAAGEAPPQVGGAQGKPSDRDARAYDMNAIALAAAVATIAGHAPAHLRAGASLGTMRIPAIALSAPMTQGGKDLYTQAWPVELQRGPAHYPRLRLPGGKYVQGALPWQKGTVGFAGHRTTWAHPFLKLNQLRKGDAIVLRTHWGTFWYKVYRMAITKPTDAVVLAGRTGHKLVLTACHPPRLAIRRLVVFAKLVGVSRTTSFQG
jgi:LPXTG-site transpeptidase (sortase) family protein